MTVVADSETVTYLGFRIVLNDERNLTVYRPDGFLIFAGRMSLSTARNLIRGYRRAAQEDSAE